MASRDEFEERLVAASKVNAGESFDDSVKTVAARDIEAILDFGEPLVREGNKREYSAELMARWALATYAEYRRNPKLFKTFLSERRFLAVANELAYVKVSSDPDGAEVHIDDIDFESTTSDGFVVVEDGEAKMTIRLKKDCYKSVSVNKDIRARRKNEFSFKLVKE